MRSLKGLSGETQLYDKQALAWIISEARKAGALCAELRKRSSGIDDSQYLLAAYRGFGPEIHNPYGNALPVTGGACSRIPLGEKNEN